jgi:predicted ribosome quality control (RQC) complex YloA/Tae2 family protein
MTVTDWSTGQAEEITLPLDPAKGAMQQVDALFKKARRIKRGVAIARERHAEAAKRLSALERLAAQVRVALDDDALGVLAKRAKAAAPGDFAFDPEAAARPAGAPRAAQPRRKAYRTFRSAGDARVLVGRGGADNDELTLHVAKPRDLWLHARGRPGAHVIVPLGKGQACPPDVLVDAAHLAAHFSDGRGEAVVEVGYTPKRFLRKPRGSPAGFVVVSREKVIALRIDEARIARLVAHEEALGDGA